MLLVIMVYLNMSDVKLSKEVPWDLVMIRFFCVGLLHIQIEAEVRQGLVMFKYMNNNPSNFKDRFGESTYLPATLLVIMQIAASIATEIINLYLILEAETAKDALMNFVALTVISEIDDIYLSTLRVDRLKTAFIETPPIVGNTTNSLRMSGRQKKQWLVRKFYKLLKFVHASYFYFLPLLVPAMAYYSTELGKLEQFVDQVNEDFNKLSEGAPSTTLF
jgi:hypothetical protein